MSGMYPNNQDIEIFGEQVKWPGVDENGKFTNGSFSDPMAKPSFIPAETVNLLIDNLTALIAKCGGTPNATNGGQLAGLVTNLAEAKRLVMRDAHGRAKVAAPEEDDDIIRKGDVVELLSELGTRIAETAGNAMKRAAAATPFGYGHVADGRNLLDVLGAATVAGAVGALRQKINADGVPDFSGLQIGDYLDLPSLNDGGTTFMWNEAYKNLRIVISGFNTFKHMGNPENAKNHIVFTFENCPLARRMNPASGIMGGYAASEIKTYLEGGFLTGLAEALGHDCLYSVSRFVHNGESSPYKAYLSAKVFLPAEIEVFGTQINGCELGNSALDYRETAQIQLPVFRDSYKHRIKRYNGSRLSWWLASVDSAYLGDFCLVANDGRAVRCYADAEFGIAPVFCVA